MEKQVIHDNEFITLWYHPDKKIIHHQFHKFTQGKTLRDCLSTGAEQMELHRAKKWLSDDRKNSVVGEDDLKWSSTHWRPRVIKAGWKYWAMVLPEKTIGKMNVNRIIKNYAETGVTVQAFTDPDEAMKWLEAQ